MAQRQQTATTTASSGDGRTVIGPGIQVNGRVSGQEDLHVEGRLEGSVALTETFYVAAAGTVVAEIKARDVVVSGVLVGNVVAEDSVTLNPGAKLVGDITAPRIIIADGASFSGNVGMGGEPPPRRERRAAPARRATPTRPAAARPGSDGASARAARPAEAPARPAASRPAAVRAAEDSAPRGAPVARAEHDDEVTIVVRHAAIGEAAEAESKAKPGAKKAPPRVRVPKPGKRRVGRR
jgi:cytoskeletal protein CcmA (bactofilin family)